MHIYPIETGNFKLDGGAMFGVVPKSIWEKTNPADEKNMIEMSMRCLLIEDGNRLILIDTGLGNKQSDKFFGYYYLFGNFSLDELFKLFDSMVKHILCYGSQVWGYSYVEEIESIQNEFCKRFLGQLTTTWLLVNAVDTHSISRTRLIVLNIGANCYKCLTIDIRKTVIKC